MADELERLDIESCECIEPDGDNIRVVRSHLMADATSQNLADLFRALADPTRVRILSAVAETEVCVNDLAEALGMGQSAVSHQLSYLREARLVRARRDGRHVFYRLDDDHVRGLFAQGLEHVIHG
jgi:ArsR family transcriptional regulator, lead/cadmium/zinc/bismuth-responsive transcriptional repressor